MKTKKTQIKVTLHIGSEKFVASGTSVADALGKMKPKRFMGITQLEIESEGRQTKLPLRLSALRLERMFKNELELQIVGKRLQTLI